jgi:hypothetical protein
LPRVPPPANREGQQTRQRAGLPLGEPGRAPQDSAFVLQLNLASNPHGEDYLSTLDYVYADLKLLERLPWVQAKRRRALRRQAEAAKAVWLWEYDHLPADVRDQIAAPPAQLASMALFDDLDREIAADGVCRKLAGHGNAEEAFRLWLLRSHPQFLNAIYH